jgi:hypothetical protein
MMGSQTYRGNGLGGGGGESGKWESGTGRGRTMTLGNGVVERSIPGAVGGVERASCFEEEAHHRRGPDRCCAVQGVLTAFVADAGRGRGFLIEEFAG